MTKILYSVYEDEPPNRKGILHKWVVIQDILFGVVQTEKGNIIKVEFNFIKIV